MPEDFYIPGQVPSSKNSKQIVSKRIAPGKTIPFLIDSKASQYYRKHYGIFYRTIRTAFAEAVKDLPKPMYIGFYFIRDSHRQFDLHNAVQVVADLMSEHGVIADDNADEFVPVFLGYHVEKEKAGVYIRPLSEDYSDEINKFRDHYISHSSLTQMQA